MLGLKILGESGQLFRFNGRVDDQFTSFRCASKNRTGKDRAENGQGQFF